MTRSGVALPALVALTAALAFGPVPAQADDLVTNPSVDATTEPANSEPSPEPSTGGLLPSDPSEPEASTTNQPTEDARQNAEQPDDIDTRGPASAESDLTEIATPANGSTVSAGAIDYVVNVGSMGTYWLDLSCDGAFQTDRYLYASYSGQQFAGQIGDTTEGQDCSLYLYPADENATGYSYITFTVAADAPTIGNPTASPAEFYPTVRDRYRDKTSIAFGSRLDSDVTVDIQRADSGVVVRSYSLPGRANRDYFSRRSVSWNGEDRGGRVVREGRYIALITSSRNGLSSTARIALQVASGYRTTRVTKTADGWYDSRDTTRGNCYATQAYPRGNDLDCWAGTYAQAAYGFRIPANAHNIRWDVTGRRQCCTPGQVIKNGTRTSETSYRVTVRVTNWASYLVRKVNLTYTYRRAI